MLTCIIVYLPVFSHDLAYVYASEALAMYSDGVSSVDVSIVRDDVLKSLGFPPQPIHVPSLFDPDVSVLSY